MPKKPVVNLIGLDSNAFSIIGECQRAARAAKWPTEDWNKVRDEMMSGDYDKVLQTALHYFDVATPDPEEDEDDDWEDDEDFEEDDDFEDEDDEEEFEDEE